MSPRSDIGVGARGESARCRPASGVNHDAVSNPPFDEMIPDSTAAPEAPGLHAGTRLVIRFVRKPGGPSDSGDHGRLESTRGTGTRRPLLLVLVPVVLSVLLAIFPAAKRPVEGPGTRAGEQRGAAERATPKESEHPAVPEAGSPSERKAGSPDAAGAAPRQSPRPPALQKLSERRELLHSVELARFSWRPDERGDALMLDLTIHNKGGLRLHDIELVCSQYAANLTLLDTSKTVLPGILQAKGRRTFRSVVGGLIHAKTHRVQCLISDLSPVAEP